MKKCTYYLTLLALLIVVGSYAKPKLDEPTKRFSSTPTPAFGGGCVWYYTSFGSDVQVPNKRSGYMTNQLDLDGQYSNCQGTKPFPGLFGLGEYKYDVHYFRNTESYSRCINLYANSYCNDDRSQVQNGCTYYLSLSVYANSFNPNNLAQNYMSDDGGYGYMAVNVPANGVIAIVVSDACGDNECYYFGVNQCLQSIPPPNACFIETSNSGPACSGGSVKLFATAPPSGAIAWKGPSFTSNVASPTVKNLNASKAGVYTVSVTYNGRVCSAATYVEVYAPPATWAQSNSPVCVGGSIRLTANATGTYAWKGPKGFTSSLKTPVINNVASNRGGIYSLTVTGTSTTGCYSTATLSIQVWNCSASRIGADETENGIRLEVGPNPTTGKLSVKAQLDDQGPLLLRWVNVMGVAVDEWKFDQETTTYEIDLDVTKHTNGVYILQAESKGHSAAKKIILQQ